MDGKFFFRQFFCERAVLNHFIGIVGLGCLIIWYFKTKDIIYLTKNGISTQATITMVDEVVSATSNSPDIYYHFNFFSYDTIPNTDGAIFLNPRMHWGRLMHLQGKTLEEGAKIQILYDPFNYDKYIFDLPLTEHLSKTRVWGLFLMGLIMLLYGELNLLWKIKKGKLY